MPRFVTAEAGFLLAVLWFDLMFDVQVAHRDPADVSEHRVASIATYYRRVTTTARPMNRLVAVIMLATLGSIVAEIARGERPHWLGWVSLVLAGAAILLAGARTVPSAVRLGTRGDCAERQAKLAQSILRDHLLCATAILALLILQLAVA